MKKKKYKDGQWIIHPDPERGIGKIIDVTGQRITARFYCRKVEVFYANKITLQLALMPREQIIPSFEVRRAWFDIFGNDDFTCPCCGYPTLTQPEFYHQCFLCSWIDDGTDDLQAHEISSSNCNYTLKEARENFEKHGHMFFPNNPYAKYFNRPIYQNHVRLVARFYFDSLFGEADPDKRREKWKQIDEREWEPLAELMAA